MRKMLIVALSALLVLSSCSYTSDITTGVKDNPFLKTYQIPSEGPAKEGLFDPAEPETPPDEENPGDEGNPPVQQAPLQQETPPVTGDQFSFVLFADPHLGRKDSGVTQHTEDFYKFLEAGNYPFAVCLGDIIDAGDIYSQEAEDFVEAVGDRTNGNFIYVLGNHDIHKYTPSQWDEHYKVLVGDGRDVTRMMRYSYGGVSFYKLDNSTRVMGKEQMNMLEEALRRDPNEYRIFLAHEVMTTGGALDQTAILFGMEAGEAMRLQRLMRNYGVSMIFTGHHHKGNITYRFDDFAEFNAAALHQRDMAFADFESQGCVYNVSIDTAAKRITLTTYVHGDDADNPWKEYRVDYFDLVSADASDVPEEEPEEPADPGDDNPPTDPEGGDGNEGGNTPPEA